MISSDGPKLNYSQDSVQCVVFEDLDLELKSALTWVCLVFQCPVNKYLCISQGHWSTSKNSFKLLSLHPVVYWWECCFR